jgi:hypothetical protein
MIKPSGHVKITFWRSGERGEAKTLAEETLRVFPVRGWTRYLILLPAITAVALLTMFIFAAFLTLFALGAVGVGLWLWWLRHKLHRAASAQALDGEYAVIKKVQVAKTDPDNLDDD